MTTKQKGKMIIYPIVLFFVLIGSFFMTSGEVWAGIYLWLAGIISGFVGIFIIILILYREIKKEKENNPLWSHSKKRRNPHK